LTKIHRLCHDFTRKCEFYVLNYVSHSLPFSLPLIEDEILRMLKKASFKSKGFWKKALGCSPLTQLEWI
uniref:Uncharacterized protein n=1 Tax=Apteryx owenii TaxID=8824 RepID=A0A8B9Q5P2_APTOW